MQPGKNPRVPKAGGLDARLHPKHKTPVGSIALIGAVALACALLNSLGAGNQEAYQVLLNASGIAYGLAYLAMFAIPLIGTGEKPSLMLRVMAGSGFAMTLLNVVLSVFPIIDVANPLLFAMKAGGVVMALNLAGALFFWRADVRRQRA